jgi:hypothetical protein
MNIIESTFDRRPVSDWLGRINARKGKLVGHVFRATGESERPHASRVDTLKDDMHNLVEHGMKPSDSVFERPI